MKSDISRSKASTSQIDTAKHWTDLSSLSQILYPPIPIAFVTAIKEI